MTKFNREALHTDTLDPVPESISGDVVGKIEQCRTTKNGSGKQSLQVQMAVTKDGKSWYTMTAYVPLDDQEKAWIRKSFLLAVGYTEEQAAAMDLTEGPYEPLCTYVTLKIYHKGQYTNVKRYYQKRKHNFVPTPWHSDYDEKMGGVQYLVEEERTELPKHNSPSVKYIIPETETPSAEPTSTQAPANQPEITSTSTLKAQQIDLSWVTLENLVAELTSRGYTVVEAEPAKAKAEASVQPAEPVKTAEPTYDDDLDWGPEELPDWLQKKEPKPTEKLSDCDFHPVEDTLDEDLLSSMLPD